MCLCVFCVSMYTLYMVLLSGGKLFIYVKKSDNSSSLEKQIILRYYHRKRL